MLGHLRGLFTELATLIQYSKIKCPLCQVTNISNSVSQSWESCQQLGTLLISQETLPVIQFQQPQKQLTGPLSAPPTGTSLRMVSRLEENFFLNRTILHIISVVKIYIS
jgi:hypothetical protein